MLQYYLSMVNTDEDRDLIEDLYINYKQLMFKTAISILHNPEMSEDAVHEAFLRVINNFDIFKKYDCKKNTSYLVIIVRGIALNKLKKNYREDELDESFADSINVEETAETNFAYSQVLECINKLSPAVKNVAYLYFVNGCSPQEIAKMLDIKVSSVYSSISRAKAILNKMLKS